MGWPPMRWLGLGIGSWISRLAGLTFVQLVLKAKIGQDEFLSI
jgi:hypothetical protein